MSNLDELREKLEGFYHRAFTDGMNDGYSPYKWTRELAELFYQYLEQETLKARIEEVQQLRADYSYDYQYKGNFAKVSEHRIKLLTTNKKG